MDEFIEVENYWKNLKDGGPTWSGAKGSWTTPCASCVGEAGRTYGLARRGSVRRRATRGRDQELCQCVTKSFVYNGQFRSGRSALSAESLSIIHRTATISARTSHFRLRGSLPCRCGVRFFDRARTREHGQARRVVLFRDRATSGRIAPRPQRNSKSCGTSLFSEKRHPSSSTGRIGARSNYLLRELLCLQTIY
jgi:hypothetical protein